MSFELSNLKGEAKKSFAESLEIGDTVEFWPTGSEKPSSCIVDQAFLDLNISEEVVDKYKYKKL